MLSIFAPLSHLFVVPTLFPTVILPFSYYDISHFYRQLDVSAGLLVAVNISQQTRDCTVFFSILKNRGNNCCPKTRNDGYSLHEQTNTGLTLRRLMSYIYIYIYIYIYGAPILDVSRSHTTTQHSR